MKHKRRSGTRKQQKGSAQVKQPKPPPKTPQGGIAVAALQKTIKESPAKKSGPDSGTARRDAPDTLGAPAVLRRLKARVPRWLAAIRGLPARLKKARTSFIGSRRSAWHDAIVPVSVIGGLLGVLAGTLPAAACVLIFKYSFPPLYLLIPLLIRLGLRLFKGYTGRPGVFLTAVFSVLGLYLTLLSTQAADHIVRFKMSVFSLPVVTAAMIGRGGCLPDSASAYVFPFIFTIIGMLLAYELFMRGGTAKK